jgi:flagellar biosynthetic protein FliQ
MTPESIMSLFRQTLEILIVLHAVILLPVLVTGLLVSMFQAATQINEMTLSFIPKLFVTILVFVLAGPWLLAYLVDHTRRLFHDIPFLIG